MARTNEDEQPKANSYLRRAKLNSQNISSNQQFYLVSREDSSENFVAQQTKFFVPFVDRLTHCRLPRPSGRAGLRYGLDHQRFADFGDRAVDDLSVTQRCDIDMLWRFAKCSVDNFAAAATRAASLSRAPRCRPESQACAQHGPKLFQRTRTSVQVGSIELR